MKVAIYFVPKGKIAENHSGTVGLGRKVLEFTSAAAARADFEVKNPDMVVVAANATFDEAIAGLYPPATVAVALAQG